MLFKSRVFCQMTWSKSVSDNASLNGVLLSGYSIAQILKKDGIARDFTDGGGDYKECRVAGLVAVWVMPV